MAKVFVSNDALDEFLRVVAAAAVSIDAFPDLTSTRVFLDTIQDGLLEVYAERPDLREACELLRGSIESNVRMLRALGR